MKLKNYYENPYLITMNFSLKVIAILIPVTLPNVSTELFIFVISFTHCYGKQSITSLVKAALCICNYYCLSTNLHFENCFRNKACDENHHGEKTFDKKGSYYENISFKLQNVFLFY